jgi:hypothetical protein
MVQKKEIDLGGGVTVTAEFNNGAFETLALKFAKKTGSLKMSLEDIGTFVTWLQTEVLQVQPSYEPKLPGKTVSVPVVLESKDPLPMSPWDVPKRGIEAGMETYDLSAQLENVKVIRVPKK